MRHGLVFAGEVEVDIGGLVALEAEEGLERDLVAVAPQRRAADGAVLFGQVDAAARLVAHGGEFGVFAVRAAVVRGEGVDLRDAGKIRHEAGTDRTSGADEVPVAQRFGNELLRHHIERGVAVADDGGKLLVQPLLHHVGQHFAVEFVRLRERKPGQLLFRAGQFRCVGLLVVEERAQLRAHVRDLVRVFNDHLKGLLFTEIAEFLQHIVGRPEIQRRLDRGVLIVGRAHEDRAEDSVLGFEEMHVARRDDRLTELVAEFNDAAVVIAERLLVLRDALADEERVVADGLDLEIIVVGSDLQQLIFVRAVHHRAEQLARFACGAEDQSLPVDVQQAPRDARSLVKMIEV